MYSVKNTLWPEWVQPIGVREDGDHDEKTDNHGDRDPEEKVDAKKEVMELNSVGLLGKLC